MKLKPGENGSTSTGIFKLNSDQVRVRGAPVTTVLILIIATVFTLQSVLHLFITESFPNGIFVSPNPAERSLEKPSDSA